MQGSNREFAPTCTVSASIMCTPKQGALSAGCGLRWWVCAGGSAKGRLVGALSPSRSSATCTLAYREVAVRALLSVRGSRRGFTQAALGAMSQRLNRSHAAVGNLTSFLRLVGLPNGMYGEEVYSGKPLLFSPVAESAYSAAASVYGMFLSSTPWPPVAQSGVLGRGPYTLNVFPAAPFSNASVYRLRAEGALLVSAVRTKGATAWVSVEVDVFADGTGTGLPVDFQVSCPDWADAGLAAVGVLTACPGVTAVAVLGLPGAFAVTGATRGCAVTLFPDAGGYSPVPDVDVALGRTVSEFNAWGSRFVYTGELP
jgi:hypothetical protein